MTDRDVILRCLEIRLLESPGCTVVVVNEDNWEQGPLSHSPLLEKPDEETFKNIVETEWLPIGNTLQKASSWLDSHSWKLIDIDPLSGRPVISLED